MNCDFSPTQRTRTQWHITPRSNTMTCVLRISAAAKDSQIVVKQVSLLLVGDIEVRKEQSLLRVGSIQSHLMLRHGCETSSSGSFLDAVQPHLALCKPVTEIVTTARHLRGCTVTARELSRYSSQPAVVPSHGAVLGM